MNYWSICMCKSCPAILVHLVIEHYNHCTVATPAFWTVTLILCVQLYLFFFSSKMIHYGFWYLVYIPFIDPHHHRRIRLSYIKRFKWFAKYFLKWSYFEPRLFSNVLCFYIVYKKQYYEEFKSQYTSNRFLIWRFKRNKITKNKVCMELWFFPFIIPSFFVWILNWKTKYWFLSPHILINPYVPFFLVSDI